MSKAKLDGEIRVQEYLSGAGFRVERFSKAEMTQGRRTPDFRIYSGGELAFYCEVKTAQEDEWDQQLTKVLPDTLADGLRADPTYNRVSGHIHKAVGQFDAINTALDYPNVFAIVNGDDGAGFTDLIQVVTGNAYCESGYVIPIFRQYSEGRIREEKLRVHLYLWFNDWKPGEPQMFFPEVHAAHHASVCRYFGVDSAKLQQLPT